MIRVHALEELKLTLAVPPAAISLAFQKKCAPAIGDLHAARYDMRDAGPIGLAACARKYWW